MTMAVEVMHLTDENANVIGRNISKECKEVAPNGKENLEKRDTAYVKLSRDLLEDERCVKELSLGKRIGFYRLRSDLGTGNFAQVKLAIHCLTKEKVAVKILDKTKLDEKTQRLLSREISSMERLSHPNLIRLFEVLESLSKIYMVVEYAPAGELFHKILSDGKLSESLAKRYFAQILSAVSHMHECNVIHRDIKAENVFIFSNNVVKVGDLGFSTCVSPDDPLNTFCGSPPYAAPELFKDDHYRGKYVDVWALGVLLFFMVTGTMPFRAETVGKLKNKILEGSFFVPDSVSEACCFLIQNILRPVPEDRFMIPEIMRSLWLEDEDFPKPLKSVSTRPNLSDPNATSEEVDTLNVLRSFGITDQMMKQCPEDSRSNVVGTYRIALYQTQRKAVEFELEREAMLRAQQDPKAPKLAKALKPLGLVTTSASKQQSKFCVIL